jgi:hypothetical protein
MQYTTFHLYSDVWGLLKMHVDGCDMYVITCIREELFKIRNKRFH